MGALVMPSCSICERQFGENESGWVEDWKVIDTTGKRATFKVEQRYTCDDCEAKR